MVTSHKWNIAYQMNPLSSGHNCSGLPEKVGQLVAAIQQNVVGKTLTSIMKGKAVNPSFVEYRPFIHEVSGAVLVELQVDRTANMGGPSLLVNGKTAWLRPSYQKVTMPLDRQTHCYLLYILYGPH